MSTGALAGGWAKALGGDRKQFDMFFDKMLDGFAYHRIVVDKAGKPVDYVFLEVNHAFEKMTGLKRERIIGKKVTDVLPGIEKDPADLISVYGRVALTGEPVQFENYVERLGKWFKVEAYCPEKGYFAEIFEDISERKEAEMQVESLARFPSENPFIVLRIASDHKILYANPVSQQIGGFVETSVGKKASENWQSHITEALSSKRQVEFEENYTEHTFLFEVVPIISEGYVNIYGTEITERKKAEEALRASEEKANNLIKYAPSGIYELDYRISPKFRSVNDAMCQILGYTREELLATNPFALLDDESRMRFRERIMKMLAGEKVDETVEFKVIPKDGRDIYAVLNVIFTYKDGKPDGALVIAHDVTERRKAERALEERAKNLESLVEERTKKITLRSLYARSLIEASLDPLVTISVEGKITDVNKATEHSYRMFQRRIDWQLISLITLLNLKKLRWGTSEYLLRVL